MKACAYASLAAVAIWAAVSSVGCEVGTSPAPAAEGSAGASGAAGSGGADGGISGEIAIDGYFQGSECVGCLRESCEPEARGCSGDECTSVLDCVAAAAAKSPQPTSNDCAVRACPKATDTTTTAGAFFACAAAKCSPSCELSVGFASCK